LKIGEQNIHSVRLKMSKITVSLIEKHFVHNRQIIYDLFVPSPFISYMISILKTYIRTLNMTFHGGCGDPNDGEIRWDLYCEEREAREKLEETIGIL